MGHAQSRVSNTRRNQQQLLNSFPDLRKFPPEVAVAILGNLNATDLCLASCVWHDLASDDVLWKRLCYEKWAYVSMYRTMLSYPYQVLTYKQIYLLLDEASLYFTYDPIKAIQYLIDNGIVEDDPREIAKMFNCTHSFYTKSIHIFLNERQDVLGEFFLLQDYSGVFLSDAMRNLFKKIPPPKQKEREFFEILMEKFSARYFECNQNLGLSRDDTSVLAYSLLLLSVDLHSPHVKNKMSKREFIRNNRQVVVEANRDLLGDLYDDVYLNGIAGTQLDVNRKLRQPFRPYGVLFELKTYDLQSCC